MSEARTGMVQGNMITLDEGVPPLDGQRVRVTIEALGEIAPSPEEQRQAWTSWVERGPQGPLEEESAPEFP